MQKLSGKRTGPGRYFGEDAILAHTKGATDAMISTDVIVRKDQQGISQVITEAQ